MKLCNILTFFSITVEEIPRSDETHQDIVRRRLLHIYTKKWKSTVIVRSWRKS